MSARVKAKAAEWLPPNTSHTWPSVDTQQRVASRRQELYDAMSQLEASVARSSRQHDWVDGVSGALARLDAALQRHVTEIEGPEGLFSEVVDRAPHLGPDVERLRLEHRDLVAAGTVALEMAGATPVDAAELRRKVLIILARLTIHRQRGSELLFDTYNVDLAAAD